MVSIGVDASHFGFDPVHDVGVDLIGSAIGGLDRWAD
jgi:hypothetical protein